MGNKESLRRATVKIDLTDLQREQIRKALEIDLQHIEISRYPDSGIRIVEIDDPRPSDSPEGTRRC